jgi:hypothetical protein
MKNITRGISLLAGVVTFCVLASAASVPIGFISWDVSFPGNAGQFDISNLTGPNSSTLPAFDFPVTTLLHLSGLSLVVDFVGGGSTTEPGSYFSLAADGESFNGSGIPIGGTNPQPIDATLTGTISPTTMTYNTSSTGNPVTSAILSTFSVKFSDSPNLADGDFGVIFATTTTAGSGVPEPGTWMLFGIGMVSLLVARLKFPKGNAAMTLLKGSLPALCAVAALAPFAPSASAQVNLTGTTSPSSGVAGVTNVNITGSSFPSGTITPANTIVTFASTCGGASVTTTPANSIRKILGSTDRVNVSIPTGLTTGNYFLTIADSVGGDTDFTTNSGSCAEVQVTGSAPILNACVAGSSMGVLLPASGAAGTVTAYVPKGFWSGATPGVFVKNIEGTPAASVSVPTGTDIINSCSSNPATGQTVCVANNKDVYVIAGTTAAAPLVSGSTGSGSFSGGTCNNCGVAVNAANNTAAINMGLPGLSGSGVQILNVATSTFGAGKPTTFEVSENISVDPTRSLVLSASEGGNYTLLQIQPDGTTLKEFTSTFSIGSESDSSAEDCSTGVAISPVEFTNDVTMVNLNNITFGAATYTAPNAVATLSTPGYGGFSAGLSGSAVAQGSGHLAVVTGEFGGSVFAVLKLPAAAGAGVPALVDYAVAQIPSNAACGGTFSAGFDPHTDTAYTSPNTGDSFAVFAGYSAGAPICLAVVDMTTVINPVLSPRGGGSYGSHEVSPANLPASAVTFFPL